MTKFTILGCGSSLGSPWITNNWGKLNKKNKLNIRTRCSDNQNSCSKQLLQKKHMLKMGA